MMNKSDHFNPPEVKLSDKINLETARILWSELQPYFAKGLCIYVAPELDLVEIANLMAHDNTAALTPLMQNDQIARVSDQQAQLFYQNNQLMWAVVVAPFVLVQPDHTEPNTQIPS